MNTLILHSAPISSTVTELPTSDKRIGLQISTEDRDSISLIFSSEEADLVADVLAVAVFKLRALKNNKVTA